MDETEAASAAGTEDPTVKTAKVSRRTAKAALTRSGKALNHLIVGERPREEVSESLLLYKKAFENLVSKHEEFTSLIDNDEEFTVHESWLDECQETFMSLETKAKLYLESKVENHVEPPNSNVEACTSIANVEQNMDGETSMQNSDGIPSMSSMHESQNSTINVLPNVLPAAQVSNLVTESNLVNLANHENPSQACGFRMEKPKMPKFTGDVREYAIFRADFKYAIEARYSKRDAMTFLRTCLENKPLELIKGIGSDYDAAWEYLDSVYGDPRYVSDTITQDIAKFKPLREGEDARFCELVHLVRRCYNTLKEVGLPSDMDNSHMLSVIEQKMCVDDRKVWSRDLQKDNTQASLTSVGFVKAQPTGQINAKKLQASSPVIA